jgi:hypothetical protein
VESNPISFRAAINFAWHTFKKHYGLLTANLLTIFCAWVILEAVVIAGQQFGILLWTLAHLAFLIFFAGMEVGLIKIGFALYNGEEPTYSDMFTHLTLGPTFLAGQLLYLLIVVVGLVLVLIPGIYLSIHYMWFGFCIVSGETNLVRSFQQSAILSAGSKIHLFAIFALLFIFNFLGACILGLGLLITIPLSVLTLTAVYRQLSTR